MNQKYELYVDNDNEDFESNELKRINLNLVEKKMLDKLTLQFVVFV